MSENLLQRCALWWVCFNWSFVPLPRPPSKVFLVRHLTDSRQVVIKQIPVDDLGKEERFSALNEVKVLAMLQHPNIIAYYDNFVDEKSLMIVMEYAPGGTLHDFIQERNALLLDEDVRPGN